VREETEEASGVFYSGIHTSFARFMIIGDVFIKNNNVVFDQENKWVGIVPLKLEKRTTLSERRV
jgi:cathepsin D/pepsin A